MNLDDARRLRRWFAHLPEAPTDEALTEALARFDQGYEPPKPPRPRRKHYNPRPERLTPMSEDMREVINDMIRYGAKEPPGGYDETWCDQGPINNYLFDRHFFACHTPWGVFCIFQAFQTRMHSPEPGESKRRIKRDIQSNPHLHTRHKKTLLRELKNGVSVRSGGRGHRAADQDFGERITGLKTLEEAQAIRADLLAHPVIPAEMRENLLFNLASYEANLTP